MNKNENHLPYGHALADPPRQREHQDPPPSYCVMGDVMLHYLVLSGDMQEVSLAIAVIGAVGLLVLFLYG